MVEDEMILNNIEIKNTGHAGFIIKTEDKTIAIDPFRIKHPEPVDFVFITHSHHDHCSPQDIEKLITPQTIIVATPDCTSKISNLKFGHLVPVEPNNEYRIKGLHFETIPAYNIDKNFHRRESDWVGYIITIAGKKIYHAGDTDLIPEMKELFNIEVALLPISGTYVMDAKEAAEAVALFDPKIAIPMHYGEIVGTKEDAEKFSKLVKEAKVIILD